MKILLVSVSLVVLLPLCSQSPDHHSGTLLLTIEEGENPERPIANAQIRVVYSNGEIRTVSHGDEIGVAKIDKQDISGGVVLIVCREGYFCGAVEIEKSDLLLYDTYSIFLARIRF